MPENPRKSPVSLVSHTGIAPPRQLGPDGQALWAKIQAEYGIKDAGGIELLYQICSAVDRGQCLAAAIDADGEVIATKAGPRVHPAVKDELANRAFIARNLERLGITVANVQTPGRPASFSSWMGRS